jgi:hypothetical protein
MGIFIIYIGIIRPLSHFDCTNFKASLVIKIINFNEIKKYRPFNYACCFPCECMITCQIFNLPHIYHIFVEKLIFLNEIFQIGHMVSKHGSNYVK